MAKDKTAKDFDDIAQAIKDGTMGTKEASKAFDELNKKLESSNKQSIQMAQNQKRVAEIMSDTLGAIEANNDITKSD